MPAGDSGDRARAPAIIALGDAGNAIFIPEFRHDGVGPYAGPVRYVAARSAALHTTVVSSSANCAEVLNAADIANSSETRIDGVTVEKQYPAGKPIPDTFLATARVRGVEAGGAAVFGNTLSGVGGGRAGRLGCVAAVDRVGRADDLLARVAGWIVADFAHLLRAARLDPA